MALGAPDRALGRLAFLATGASIYVMWNAMTVVGALGAAALGGTARAALDAIVPAAFLALLWPRLRTSFPEAATQRRVALGGAVIALVLTPFVPPGVQVIAAVVAVALAGPPRAPSGRRRRRRWRERHRALGGGARGSAGLLPTQARRAVGAGRLGGAAVGRPDRRLRAGRAAGRAGRGAGGHQTGGGRSSTVGWSGSRSAAVALALRAPFIVVLLLAGAAGAVVHVLAG